MILNAFASSRSQQDLAGHAELAASTLFPYALPLCVQSGRNGFFCCKSIRHTHCQRALPCGSIRTDVYQMGLQPAGGPDSSSFDRRQSSLKPIATGRFSPRGSDVRLVLEADPQVAADVAAAERAVPGPQQLAHRDPAGMYTPQAPFWATLVAAERLTATWSDRTVRVFLRP